MYRRASSVRLPTLGDIRSPRGACRARRQKTGRRARKRTKTLKKTAEDDHASVWLGMIVHALLSWKARIGRMIARRSPARASPMRRRAGAARIEPRFDEPAATHADADDDDGRR